MADATSKPVAAAAAEVTVLPIILAVSFCHMLNDIMQSMISAIYPMLKADFALDFWQIGILTLAFQCTASLLQPVIGIVTDKKPFPYSLPFGMGSTFIGLFILAWSQSYLMLVVAASLIGIGSAVFHPESSRVARLASGGRYGFAQATFQVGGNFGQSIGPLLAAFIIVPNGQGSVAWFSVIAMLGIFILAWVARWYKAHMAANKGRKRILNAHSLSKRTVATALVVLALLTFSKNIYMASISSYYTFFVIERFGVTVQQSQIMLFIFLGAVALGTVIGGPIGDRFGTKVVIWFSILGALPFTLAMPFANLPVTIALSAIVGFIMASSFPAIVVMAQELVPGRVGMIAGIFFGLAFGIAGIAAAVLGVFADLYGISFVYTLCAFLPALGLLTVFLPGKRALRVA
ncbi:FSR family fosmidomycin resistance protein-like MFS transporter [Neorhizobium sp. R1-B]|uniref:MFS transporter n=1 Tax=unclassified Neorhizobium TaxID=2629175 RepID=UPI00104F2F87|nr:MULTISPECIES: MFS transporter [unclassified Neorhizobium]TCV74314.1 FSR family fosmidomycin resistance protein-like MFS transporter [Neorhizobium sp. S3-V5DH]TDX87500.1 FSR family fosmidomycin resistance protein-like MFS transporter [Neorhizobium sp. R1-B]